MQSRFEMFNQLQTELKIVTAQNLSNSDLPNVSLTSKYHLGLFKPMMNVRKLLHYVTRGEHEAVEAMLKNDISLIFKKGKVTDCSGRTFNDVSCFEYALWGLDKHMWAVMLACIPQNEEGKKVFANLLYQYDQISTDGVTYRLNGNTITEKHFDFENTIIKELQTQVDLINAPNPDWDAIDKQWKEGVGGAQKLLLMHVVDVYCSNELFYPVPKFTSRPESSRQFYNWITRKYEYWFDVDSRLGSDFAIYKGVHVAGRAGEGCGAADRWGRWVCTAGPRAGGSRDLAALKALFKERTMDFIDLKTQLEEQVDNHHQKGVPM